MANIRNSKLFATITAVKIIVFIVKVVIFIFIKITIHCHAVIDQLLQAVISEGQMSVFTSQTGLNLLLVFFLRRPQFHLWICVEVYFWRCTTWFLRNHFYFPGIVRLDWTCGNESTTRRLSNTQGSYPKFWGHPKTQTMQTADRTDCADWVFFFSYSRFCIYFWLAYFWLWSQILSLSLSFVVNSSHHDMLTNLPLHLDMNPH